MNNIMPMPEPNSQSRKRTLQYLVLLAASIITLALPLHAQAGNAIIVKVIEAYGGRERLAKVSSISAEGRITAIMRGDEGTYRRTLRRDGSLFVDIVYTRSTERRILHKGRGYRGTGGKLEEVSGPRYQAMAYQYNELNLPYGLLDDTFSITELRNDVVGEEAVHVFRCTDRKGNQLDLFISVKSFRIVKCEGAFVVGTERTTLSSEYGDYRMVDGILLPLRIINYAGGAKISVTTIDRYRINPAVDDALFVP